MKIKKIKSQGEFCYPATIAAAVKDANFLKEDNFPMTLGEINLYLNAEIGEKSDLSDTYTKTEVDNKISILSNDHTVFKREMTDTTAEIAPNTFYIWGEVSELTITLADPDEDSIYNEYMFQFTSGDTATTLSLPDTITWYLDNDTILANKTYQVSIVNNLAVLGEF